MKLATKGLDFAYGDKEVLSGVAMRIAPGRMVCLTGPNGSGKSTLLRCLDRILRPQRGVVLIDNRDINELSLREMARRVSYLPQSEPQTHGCTVFENVLMGRRPYMRFRVGSEDRDVVSRMLALLNLENMASRNFDELSGGERQKVSIARALAQQTDILLLDEPTSNLDLRYQLEVAQLLTRLKRERRLSLVLAIHDLNLAAGHADHVVMLHQGRVFDQGPPAQVLNQQNIRTVYGVEAKIEQTENGRPHIKPLRPVCEPSRQPEDSSTSPSISR